MIVVDTSALLAIIQDEPENLRFYEIIKQTDRAMISTISVLEAGMVLRARRGPNAVATLMDLIESLAIEPIPFDITLAVGALDAFARYGKGFNPAARLNLGDCCSYALAKKLGASLLFKGNDFIHTDVDAIA